MIAFMWAALAVLGVLAVIILGAFARAWRREVIAERDTPDARPFGWKKPQEIASEPTGWVDSSPSALMARIDASLAAAHEAPVEAPGEMPAGQDDPGPLYSWSTGQFAAVMADDGPEVA